MRALTALTVLMAVYSASALHETWPLAGGIEVQAGTHVQTGNGRKSVRIAVFFDEPFSVIPRVKIIGFSNLAIAAPPIAMTHGFLVDVISADELTDSFEMQWAASYQGPCETHDACPSSQYCDKYRGCDDCAVCRALFDTFDEAECPEKCRVGGQAGSGSGEDIDAAASFQDGVQPCVVCPVEEYPCGDRCVDVFGLVLPECYEPAGCAVGALRGALFQLGDDALSASNASETKAALALERAASIDPHFADPQLSRTLERVQSVSKCTGVVCPGETQCLQASVCQDGICQAQVPKEAGLTCDDGNVATDEDACDPLGQCVGIDYCDTVTCPPSDTCRQEGVCFRGNCSYELAEVGTNCSDDDPLTDNDQCQADGTCQGEILCITQNIQCPPETPCLFESVCQNGQCFPRAAKPDDTPCENAIFSPNQSNGTCRAGICITTKFANDECLLDVECQDGLCPDFPHVEDGTICTDDDDVTCTFAECRQGACFQDAPQPLGLSCDDNNSRTTSDICQGDGTCAGEDLCIVNQVICDSPPNVCHMPNGDCFRGNCTYFPYPDGTQCSDGDGMTDFDQCQAGECVGILQPTVGPEQGMGYETEAFVDLMLSDRSQLNELLSTLQQLITSLIPGVYSDDVRVELADNRRRSLDTSATRIHIEISTRVFGKDHVVSSLTNILNDTAIVLALQASYPALHSMVIVQAPVAVLRCLTPVSCPTLMCADDEIEYRSQYASVRRCCPVCIRRVEYFERELEAYAIATEHWREAQQQQDADYIDIDLVAYNSSLSEFKAHLAEYQLEAAGWDAIWANYTSYEDLYYRLTCP